MNIHYMIPVNSFATASTKQKLRYFLSTENINMSKLLLNTLGTPLNPEISI